MMSGLRHHVASSNRRNNQVRRGRRRRPYTMALYAACITFSVAALCYQGYHMTSAIETRSSGFQALLTASKIVGISAGDSQRERLGQPSSERNATSHIVLHVEQKQILQSIPQKLRGNMDKESGGRPIIVRHDRKLSQDKDTSVSAIHPDETDPNTRQNSDRSSSLRIQMDPRRRLKATLPESDSSTQEPQAKKQKPLKISGCKPLLPPKWEFVRFRRNKGQTMHPKKRLLIGMYSGFDDYARMLDVTAIVNKAYARRWGHDTVTLQGITMHLGAMDGGEKCTPKAGVRPAFNKIMLLKFALLHRSKYDQLLLVDTDAMMYDLDYDITSMMDSDTDMLVAQRVHKYEKERGNYDVNNGVMLWNLHHEETAGVVSDWEKHSRKSLMEFHGVGGDQHQLHKALKHSRRSEKRLAAIKGTYGEFTYGRGTVVRHYIRDNEGWNSPNPLERRIERLENAKNRVCQKYRADVCGSIPRVSYGVSASTEIK